MHDPVAGRPKRESKTDDAIYTDEEYEKMVSDFETAVDERIKLSAWRPITPDNLTRMEQMIISATLLYCDNLLRPEPPQVTLETLKNDILNLTELMHKMHKFTMDEIEEINCKLDEPHENDYLERLADEWESLFINNENATLNASKVFESLSKDPLLSSDDFCKP